MLPDGLVLAACLEREDARDVLISHKAKSIGELPRGATIGSASLRRQAQVKLIRRDINIVPLRGNVGSRLQKISEGVADATILALAGLKRLGLADKATAILDPRQFLPAVGQGAIGIEIRDNDDKTRACVGAINHAATLTALTAERAFLTVLDGSCKTPIAGHATLDGDLLSFRGLIVKPDGSVSFETSRRGAATDAAMLGADAAKELKQRAGSDFFAEH
jgi:hydroxymethylbilane synthase